MGDSVANMMMRDVITKVVIIIVLVLLAYLLIVRPILKKVGIIESAEDKRKDKEQEQLATSPDSPFNPNYYKAKNAPHYLTRESAEQMADELNDAIPGFWKGFVSGWGDDENGVFGVLKKLQSKRQLSYLSEVFYERHGMDLYTVLKRNLTGDMDTIISIVSKLP
jgi:hypothetical protein